MLEWFLSQNHIIQALLATLFTWSITALGACIVFIFQTMNKTFMDGMLGFSAGVMIAASFWSLLDPSIEMAKKLSMPVILVVSTGFLMGGGLLFIGDHLFSGIQQKLSCMSLKKTPLSDKRCFMLILSITLHNIPEGMAVGVAFGSLAYGLEGATLPAACLLALGIGLQNFPEGTAVSVPLRRDGYTPLQAFFYGQLSGFVEPIAGVIGALLVLRMRYLLPFLLAFAAGAMIYVVVEELIPESQSNERKEWMAIFTLVGFSVMMILDLSFA